MSIFKALAGACLAISALAAPAVVDIEVRQAAPITNQAQLDAALSSLTSAREGQDLLSRIRPAARPQSIAEAAAGVTKITNANPGDIFRNGAEILLNGFTPADFATIAQAYLVESNTNNINLRPAVPPVFPRNGPNDAPYSLSEQQLRRAIYIPPDYQYGRGPPPVIFLPGTGALSGQNFGPNFAKLFRAQGVADPVFLNLPAQNLDDIQIAAEYAAYAINYISRISNNVKVSWSGCLV